MIINLEGSLEEGSLDKVIDSYNDCIKNQEALHIYLNSPGGIIWIGTAIADLINRHAEMTTLTAYGAMQSAALYLFMWSKCEKRILPETFAMIHTASWTHTIVEGGKPKGDYDEYVYKHMKDYGKVSGPLAKQLLLSDDEIQKFKEGRDIFLPYKRLERAFPEETKKGKQ